MASVEPGSHSTKAPASAERASSERSPGLAAFSSTALRSTMPRISRSARIWVPPCTPMPCALGKSLRSTQKAMVNTSERAPLPSSTKSRAMSNSIDRASGTFVVLGQTVSAENGIISDKNGQSVRSISDLAVGDSIEVSGLRRDDGVIAASRIEKRASPGPSLIRGTVTGVGNGGFAVSGYRLALSPNQSFPPPTVGAHVAVTGSMSQGSFVPRRVERVPETPFGGRLKRLSIEGFVGRGPGSALSVGGMPLAGTKGAAQPRFGDRVIINGPLDERRHLIPTTMRPAPMNFRLRNGHGDLGVPGRPIPDFRRGRSDAFGPGSTQRRQLGPQTDHSMPSAGGPIARVGGHGGIVASERLEETMRVFRTMLLGGGIVSLLLSSLAHGEERLVIPYSCKVHRGHVDLIPSRRQAYRDSTARVSARS